MARFDDWVNQAYGAERGYLEQLEIAYDARRKLIYQAQHDLALAAADLGQTEGQIGSKMDELFSTYGAEWSVYILTGATAIITAIQNDVSIAWLDTVYPAGSGVTLRTRLINRLNS